MRTRRQGFTLIELMIVVAIIGILASIAIPKFADLLRKSSEGAGKGNLASVRSALSVYYANMEGTYPTVLQSITIGGNVIATMPKTVTPNYHADTIAENDGLPPTVSDASGWHYDNTVGDANFGTVVVDCTHTDTKGTVWSSY